MKRGIIKWDDLTLQSELTIAENNQGDILTMGSEDLFASKMSQQYSISNLCYTIRNSDRSKSTNSSLGRKTDICSLRNF
ncbi:unnamed protein product [Rhizophagus irregularis]|nr:unnamed protein product [Rhizophagus irregularis]